MSKSMIRTVAAALLFVMDIWLWKNTRKSEFEKSIADRGSIAGP